MWYGYFTSQGASELAFSLESWSVWTAGRGHSPQRTASSLAETRSFRSRGVSVCAQRKAPRLLPAFSEGTVGHLKASLGPAPPRSHLSPGHGVTAPSGPESPASPSTYPWLLPSLTSCVQLLPSVPHQTCLYSSGDIAPVVLSLRVFSSVRGGGGGGHARCSETIVNGPVSACLGEWIAEGRCGWLSWEVVRGRARQRRRASQWRRDPGLTTWLAPPPSTAVTVLG